jgi:hypothetical protein
MDLSMLYGVPNQSFFDSYWAGVHFAVGVCVGGFIIYLFRYLKRPLSIQTFKYGGFAILLAWEYFEVFLRFIDIHQPYLANILSTVLLRGFFEIENTTNIVSDLILGGFGLYVAYFFWKRNENRG